MNSKIKKRALVLSGGGNRGAYEVGVLKHLVCDRGVRYDTVIGVSVGALNSVFLAQYNKKEQHKAVLELEGLWKNIQSNMVYEPWDNSYFKSFIYSFFGKKPSFLDSSPLEKLILSNKKTEKLNSDVDLMVGVTDLQTGVFKVINGQDEHIDKYILASSSIPVIFPPVEINGKYFVDGGIRSNTPLHSILENDQYEAIDVIMLVPREEEFCMKNETPKTVYGILYKTVEILGHKILHSDINIVNTFHFIEELKDSNISKKTKINIYAPQVNLLGISNFFTVLDFDKQKILNYIKTGYHDAVVQFNI